MLSAGNIRIFTLKNPSRSAKFNILICRWGMPLNLRLENQAFITYNIFGYLKKPIQLKMYTYICQACMSSPLIIFIFGLYLESIDLCSLDSCPLKWNKSNKGIAEPQLFPSRLCADIFLSDRGPLVHFHGLLLRLISRVMCV